MKKLIPAIVMLLVSAVVLSTASYAWFTTTTTVEASGMSVKATAPSSILIKGIMNDGEYSTFSHTVVFDQATTALSPVSSHDGVNFYAAAECDDQAGAMKYDSALNTVTSNKRGYVVTYTITLKNDATSSLEETTTAGETEQGESIDICLAELKSTSGRAIDDAIRVAFTVDGNTFVFMLDGATEQYVFVPEYDEDTKVTSYNVRAAGPIAQADAAETILTKTKNGTDAEGNDTFEYAGYAYGTASNYSKTVKESSASEATKLTTLAPQQEKEITITIWYEGQASACVGANGGLSSSIQMAFTKLAAGE